MSKEDILKRTAQRKREGKNQTYFHHKRVGTVPPHPVKPLVTSTTPTCIFLGKMVPGGTCGARLHECTKFGEVTTRFVKCKSATRHCATCKVPEEEKYPTENKYA